MYTGCWQDYVLIVKDNHIVAHLRRTTRIDQWPHETCWRDPRSPKLSWAPKYQGKKMRSGSIPQKLSTSQFPNFEGENFHIKTITISFRSPLSYILGNVIWEVFWRIGPWPSLQTRLYIYTWYLTQWSALCLYKYCYFRNFQPCRTTWKIVKLRFM